MTGNSFGKAFTITTFGESHGQAIGVVIDGCPALLEIDLALINAEMQRRKPGQSEITSPRKEEDEVEILSGVFEGKSTGTPICLLIKNKDHRSHDYSELKNIFRPSHADYTYQEKYGLRDYRGGGRASARETAARVAAGAIAKMLLKKHAIEINAFVTQIGSIALAESDIDLDLVEKNKVRCPNSAVAKQMVQSIETARSQKDSLGGIITCWVSHCPVGLGEPVFDKLEADLAKAIMSIPATKGFEIGSGFSSASMLGSNHNDAFQSDIDGHISTASNYSGGIQGGISNGERIEIKAAFKPVATIGKEQQTIDSNTTNTTLAAKGRHDPCVVPRAVPIVEAMVALVIADHLLRNRLSQV